MIKTNRNSLIKVGVEGKVASPRSRGHYEVDPLGNHFIFLGMGGICYSHQVGDCCMGIVGDHVEPGVTFKNSEGPQENAGFNLLACIGNKAKIISGDAKGEIGFVSGKHGGAEHVMVYFEKSTLEKMTLSDKVLIKGFGQGLKVEGFEDISFFSIDPDLVEKIIRVKEDCLEIDVTCVIPAFLMGSGLGSAYTPTGDYDIMTRDHDLCKELKMDQLKFGDFVLIQDHDGSVGYDYCKGAVTVGVIIHGDSNVSGHGPGVTPIMTCRKPRIKGVINPNANLINYIKSE